MSEAPLKVLLADDDEVLRRALTALFDKRDDVELVGVAENGAEAISMVRHHVVDVVLLDADMPVVDGITAAERIAQIDPTVTVVILTAFEQESFLDRALAAGASGFLTKDIPVEEIMPLLRRARSGDVVMGARPTEILANSYRERAMKRDEDADFIAAVNELAPRMREVFDLIVAGCTNREIADQLFLTDSSVRTYVNRVIDVVGSSSRAQLLIRAARTGLLD